MRSRAMENLSVDDLKLRTEHLRTELEQKNLSIAKMRNQLSALHSQMAIDEDQIQVLKAQGNAKRDALQKKLDELDVETETSNQHFQALLSKQSATITTLKNDILTYGVLLKTEQPILESSFNNTTNEQEEKRIECDVKQTQLENLHKQHDDLKDQLNVLQGELEQVLKQENEVKTDLLEANELVEIAQIEASALVNSLNACMTTAKEESLFDEVNNPRKALLKNLQVLRKHLNDLQMQVEEQKKMLISLCNLKFNLEEVIEKHPIECVQNLEEMLFNYKVYVKKLRNLCNRLGNLLTERDLTIKKWMSVDVADFYTKLCKQHQKYNEEAEEYAYAEYRIMKLKSIEVREKTLEILKEEREIERLSSKNKKMAVVPTDLPKNMDSVKETVANEIEEVANSNVTKRKNHKKVEFQAVEVEPSSRGHVRRGGQVLEYKTVFMPSKLKRKKKL